MEMEEVATESGQVETTAGEKLRAAREAAGKSLADISALTRVPTRMLDALERNALGELPAGPYAIGFARTFAQAVGLDANAIAAEIGAVPQAITPPLSFAMDQFEPVASDRVPTRALAWVAAGIALAMVVAYLVWKSLSMSPPSEAPPPPSAQSETTAAPTAAVPSPTTDTGQAAVPPAVAMSVALASDAPVRIAASERVWFSLEDAQGRSQFDLTLDGGEFYTVKPGQRALTLRTGRPQSLRILIGDTRLPQLGANDAVVSGVALDSASLSQRLNPPASQPAAIPTPIPAPIPQR